MMVRAMCAVGIVLLAACGRSDHGAETKKQHAGHTAPGPAMESAARTAPPHVHSPESGEQPSEHAGHEMGPSSEQEQPAGSATSTGSAHAEHGVPPSAQGAAAEHATPPGYSAVMLDQGRARSLGLTTAPVEMRDFTRSLRTVGVVALDETRTSHVHSKVRGWIDRIHVDFVGKHVRAGQPLVAIYSQEIYAAELEFVSILEQPPIGAGAGEFALAEREARERLVAGARQRLSLWDVPKAEIARLERTRTPQRTFTLIAPRSGIVLAKQAIAGMFIDPSLELYLISDIRKLWVLADVYDSDVRYVKLGDEARLSIEGDGAEPIAAKVVFVSPTIDEATRTLKVRFDVDNRDQTLRPGAFVTVEMQLEEGRGLSVPEDAVIRTGPRSIVFVVHGEHIEPREVQLGPNVAGRYRVESGLGEGEQVATGAQFLLDSESRLRASSAPGGAHVH